MSFKVDKVQLEIIMKSDTTRAEIIKLEDQAKSLQKEMKKLKNNPEGLAKASAEYDKVKNRMTELRKTIGLTGMTMRELQQRQKELNMMMRSMDPRTEKFKEYQTELVQVNSRMKELRGTGNATSLAFGNMTGGLNKLLVSMSTAPGIIGIFSARLIGLGAVLKTFLLNPVVLAASAIVGLFTGMFSLVKHSMAFSKALSELSALTGATGKDLDYLKRRAKDLGEQYGMSAEEIVVSMKKVGSAKAELLENVTALSAVTAAVIKLSKATSDDLGETTTSVTTIMNQFGFTASQAERVVNVLAAGSKYGAGEVDYLGESISKVGAIAKNANVSLEAATAVMEK